MHFKLFFKQPLIMFLLTVYIILSYRKLLNYHIMMRLEFSTP